MLELLQHGFGLVCGQNPDHTWAPGGVLLPFCQRCTGLYVGAAVAALLHGWLRPKLTARFLWMHVLFLLLMAPCGFHWVPQGPALRACSGVLFGFGVVGLLRAPLGQRAGPVRFSQAWECLAARLSRSVWSARGLPPLCGALEYPKAPASRTHSKRFATNMPGVLRETLTSSRYLAWLLVTILVLPLLAAQGGRMVAVVISMLAFAGALTFGGLSLAVVWVCLTCLLQAVCRSSRSSAAP